MHRALKQGRIYTTISGTKGDTSPSLWLFFDDCRYLINCGEGFQRTATEHSLKLSKLKSIFLTDLGWESVGGLPGSLLTISDTTINNNITIWGPRCTSLFMHSCRYFINRPKLHLSIRDNIKTNLEIPCYKDNNITVYPLILKAPNEPLYNNNFPYSLETSNKSNSAIHIFKNYSDEIISKLTIPSQEKLAVDELEDFPFNFKPSTSICCYCFHTPNIRGKFDTNKAKLLGIQKGPLFGKLSRGESVQNMKGETIYPKDVMLPDIPGNVIIVIKCPSIDYISSLIESNNWSKYQKGGEYDTNVCTIYHITPDEIINHPQYIKWIQLFSCKNHIAINNSCNERIVFQATSTHQEQFHNYIDKEIFPQLHENINISTINDLIKPGELLDIFNIRPKVDNPFKKHNWELSKKLIESEDIFSNETILPDPINELKKWDNFEITFLGTASCVAGKYRNVSGIHLRYIHDNFSLLMDAGEGTLGQLYRLYGNKLDSIILSLKFIFITHLHADHHLGLNRIIQYRQALIEKQTEYYEPIHIIGPYFIYKWLLEYGKIVPCSYSFTNIAESKIINNLLGPYNLYCNPISVIHCTKAYGFIFKHITGWKLVYSGDTRPCTSLEKSGYNCDLLIHEATFEDGMERKAVKKRHSTISEAITVGENMNANYILLTHFSQRYPKFPVINSHISSKIGLAFDYMRIKFSWLNRFPVILPIMEKYFEYLNLKGHEISDNEEIDLNTKLLAKKRSNNNFDIPIAKKAKIN